MVSRASLKYLRMSPRKFRLVIPLVKGKGADEAIGILMATKKLAAKYAVDLIKSALANASRIHGVDTSDLYISKLTADGGPQLKRFRAASMGRASMIRKRTTHITLELDARKEGIGHPAKAQAHKHVKIDAKHGASEARTTARTKRRKASGTDLHVKK